MAIGIYFSPAAMSAAKYDECIKLLKKAGAGSPAGRSYHAAFGPKDKLMVFRCMDIAGGVRQVREDADAHPSTTRDRYGTAGRDAGAQVDRAGGEGHVAQEAGESLCWPPEALTTTGPSPQRLSVPLLERVR